MSGYDREGAGMSEAPRQRLARLMNEQRVKLKLRWTAVADRAGMDESHLRRIRRGEIEITDYAAWQIEEALNWEPGSINEILAGKLPTEKPPRIDVDPLRDETEREMWKFVKVTGEETVWQHIDERRERLAEEAEKESHRGRRKDNSA